MLSPYGSIGAYRKGSLEAENHVSQLKCWHDVDLTKMFSTSSYIIVWLFMLVDFYRSLERGKGLTLWRCGISGLKMLLYHSWSALPCRRVRSFENVCV